jgi:acetyl-CoA carboxylase biotin carboxyl carrier protein
MNLPEIERLVELVQGANIAELTLRHNGTRVTIRKSPSVAVPSQSEALTLTGEGDTAEPAFHLDMEPEDTSAEDDVLMVKSPLVGTFRHAKSPVVLGAIVREGQVLGIIEAMKLPNEVTAPEAGKVVEALVEEGQFVEYGQDLYAIQPSDQN